MLQSIFLHQNEIAYLSNVLHMIDCQNWQALQLTILNNPAVFQTFSLKISKCSELNGMTFLHACVRYNPPAHIVQLIVNLNQESANSVDCLGRTALHIAAGTRADVSTIQILTEACPMAVDIQDQDGKTPLHFACDSSCELFEGDENLQRPLPCLDSIKILLSASCMSVATEDEDGMSPLEYAIMSEADYEVITLLQKATQIHYMKRQQVRGMMKRTNHLSHDMVMRLWN
mmetsp:Transcript_20478/g.41102  ORF Transcript_20478/g.41102 Transcript_20478/m.41102 type:complete len:230 (+) Transcript_20478:174-863(+)